MVKGTHGKRHPPSAGRGNLAGLIQAFLDSLYLIIRILAFFRPKSRAQNSRGGATPKCQPITARGHALYANERPCPISSWGQGRPL